VLKLQENERGVVFEVFLQPRAKKDEIAGIQEGSLKVRVTSPPLQGRANQACIDVIAYTLGLKKSAVEIISGHTSRRKRLCIRGITLSELKKRLGHLIE
jgi:hypothetical protein